jgi:2',3'-cyclic-nucleotide 2'-phosphodiesterase (5'-nucleotidase family)
VLLLSAGDDMQGTAISNLSWGAATIASHNALRYTAAAFGNHEFDWGVDTLRARVRESRFPWLAANVVETATGRAPSWVTPWAMFDTLGVRVAVIGAALPETPWVVLADRVAGLTFLPAAPAIDVAARAARAAGADFVVVTMHIGVTCLNAGTAPRERSTNCVGDAMTVADALTERVDLIVGGHTHRRAITSSSGVPIVEAGSYSQALSITDLERRGPAPARVTDQRVAWVTADSVTPSPTVANIVESWDRRVRPLTERVVAELGEVMRSGERDSYLGNTIADAFLAATKADVVLLNNGSLRRPLPAGPVTFGMLYELQPFQNELVVVTAPVSVLREALEHGARGPGGRVSVHLAGARVTLDTLVATAGRVRAIELNDGRVLRDTDMVRIGLTDFVAGGGDRFTMFGGHPRESTGIVDVDALVRYLAQRTGPVMAPRDRRFILADSRAPRP